MSSHDPAGHPRTIPVRHRGVVVWHSAEEYARLTAGVVCGECGEPVGGHAAGCPAGKAGK